MYLSTIPFAGFYESVHDDQINQAFEDEDPSSSVFEAYAQEYATAFLDDHEIEGGFESLISPREYNFETDRIFVKLTPQGLRDLVRQILPSDFDKLCRERFTSRSGFISFYSPNYNHWGPPSSWDHNQIGTLMECLPETDELDLMEPYICNGRIYA